MRPLTAISVFGIAAGVASIAPGQTEHAASTSLSSSYAPSATEVAATAKPAAAATPDERNVDGDDTLYRGKTSETENPMLRDEGPIHLKPRAREKVQEVDSKSLHTSGTDPKFQGSLLHSGVTSVYDISDTGAQEPEVKDEGDPRFRTRRLIFSPQANDESKKKEKKVDTKADASPSPSPTPTPAPSPKTSSR